MSFLTGSKPKSSSSNLNNSLITSTYTPQMQQGVQGTNFLANLLGLGGDSAATGAFNTFRNASGYQDMFNEAQRGVTNSAAGRGLLGSGATARALQTTAGNLANQSMGNYIGYLGNLISAGNQAGGLIANTGQQSTSKGGSGGLLGAVGAGLSIFSDRRVKRDIRKVGEFPDGLGIYTYRYLGSKNRVKGVMADEVAILRPWALGPTQGGFQTVNYGAL